MPGNIEIEDASGTGTGSVQHPTASGATACTRTPAESVQVARQRSPSRVAPTSGDTILAAAEPSRTLGMGTSDTFMNA